MAYLRNYYRCPTCNRLHDDYTAAMKCRNTHPIVSEQWAVGKHKKVKPWGHCAPGSMGSVEWALQEADLSDFIEERKRQLAILDSIKLVKTEDCDHD